MGRVQTLIARHRHVILRTARLVAATAALLMAAPSVVYLRTTLEPGHALYKDFGQEYLLARAVADRTNPYVNIRDLAERYLRPDGLLDKAFPTPHPPSAGAVFLPFLVFNYATAVEVWFVVQAVSLLLGVALVLRVTQLPVKMVWVPVIAFALVGWRPILVDLALGQVTIVILALLAAAELMLQRKHSQIAGAVLGLSMLIKPLAWPWLVVLLWRRQWSAAAACVVVALVGFAVPAALVGPGPEIDYVTHVLPSVSASYATEMTNISLWTIGPRVFGLTAAGQALGAAIPLVVLAITLLWLRRRPAQSVALAIATCLSILVNPISWEYSLVLLLLPLAELLHQLRRRNFPRRIAVSALLVTVALYATSVAWPTALVASALASAVGVLLVWSTSRESPVSVVTTHGQAGPCAQPRVPLPALPPR